MTLFLPATIPARDMNGTVLGNAVWNFYHKQTLTPADVVGAGSTVTSDGSGDFAPITLETDITYRSVLKDASGKVLYDIGAVLDSYFAPAVKQAMDSNNRVLSGAKWSFFTAGTTTRQKVYSDDSFSNTLGYVVTANGAGVFQNIYLNDAVTYKAVLQDSSGTVLATLDPVSTNTMATYLDPSALITVSPSADFNGTAGTGFGAPYGEVPTDPTRTTAKPAMRLLVPDRQTLTDTLLVGVYAGANNAGSLYDNMGLEKVIFHYEGSTAEALAPSFRTFDDANGNPVTYWGWWCQLEHNGTNGTANFYVEAVPADTSMQSRVLGPYVFLPSATMYDYSVTVAATGAIVAGVSYQTVKAALDYLYSVTAHHPRITITEAGTYALDTVTTPWSGANGRCRIDATAAVVFAKPNEASKGQFRPRYSNLWFHGSNITFDAKWVSEVRLDEAIGPWLDGVNFINSAGRAALWDKGQRPVSYFIRGSAWFTECIISGLLNPCLSGGFTLLARGCTLTSVASDVFSQNACVIGNTVNDANSFEWKTNLPAMTVQYTGAGATATTSLSGGNDDATRTFTCKVDGVSVGAITLQNTVTTDPYFDVSDVVTWINTLTDWTATLLDDTRRATALAKDGSTFGWTDYDAKTAPQTLIAKFDLHGDWYQVQSALENVVIADNVGTDLETQDIFFTGQVLKDFLVVNNVWHNGLVYDYVSQFSAAQGHVVLAHNTWANQVVWHRTLSGVYNPDTYCLFANNTFSYWSAFSSDTDLVTTNNHQQTGTGYGTNVSVGGTEATLFADSAGGDFTPVGALLANLKTPVVKYDQAQALRGTTAPAGALA